MTKQDQSESQIVTVPNLQKAIWQYWTMRDGKKPPKLPTRPRHDADVFEWEDFISAVDEAFRSFEEDLTANASKSEAAEAGAKISAVAAPEAKAPITDVSKVKGSKP